MSRRLFTWSLVALLVFVLAAAESFAESMFAENYAGDRVVLFDEPCTNGKILAVVEKAFVEAGAEVPTDLQAGEVRFAKEGTFPICWRVNAMLQVGFVYEDGVAAAVPLLAFQPEVGL